MLSGQWACIQFSKITWSSMSLHKVSLACNMQAVSWVCMQFHGLYAVSFFVWTDHENFAVLLVEGVCYSFPQNVFEELFDWALHRVCSILTFLIHHFIADWSSVSPVWAYTCPPSPLSGLHLTDTGSSVNLLIDRSVLDVSFFIKSKKSFLSLCFLPFACHVARVICIRIGLENNV